jgi:hypothetical protein
MPEEEKGPRPTHELKLLDIETGDNGLVGVAWLRKGDFLSIKLNPGVVLSYESLQGKALTLFKVRSQEEWDAIKAAKRQPSFQKEEYPPYIRKIHLTAATAHQCPNRVKAKAELTDDPSKVTCGKCKKILA